MKEKETITMTKKEVRRLGTINDLIENKINGTVASSYLNLSTRQVRRMKSMVLLLGPKGIVHKSRGRPSNRKMGREKENTIKHLIHNQYRHFGPTLASEYLLEYNKVVVNKETLRLMMIKEGIWASKKRKQEKHHEWRERKDNYGEMQQFDGSYHKWFGEEESCLLLSIDDATGKISHGVFDKNEGVIAVFKFWIKYIEKNGIPRSIYLDKFSTYKINHKSAEDNKDLITQFQRANKEVGINMIMANSPEAKGRIERANKTLQDRLVKALKFHKITTRAEANKYLEEKFIPEFNKRFAVVPKNKENRHSLLNSNTDLRDIFSIRKQRVVCNDYTIRFENKYFQLEQIQPTTVFKRDKVIVQTNVDGKIVIKKKEHLLNSYLLPTRPQKEIDVKLIAITRKKSNWKPPANHPWKSGSFKRKEERINSKVGHF
jgi:hypothetical protein